MSPRRATPTLPGDTDVVKQHFVLRRPPCFSSAHGDPDVVRATQTFFGWDDPGAAVRRIDEIRRGALPAPGGALLRPALADPSQSSAPDCLLAIDSTFPGMSRLTGHELEAIHAVFPAATVRRLRDYVTNLADDAIANSHIAPLRSVPRRVAVTATGPAHYRVAGIGRLYLAGADRHPGSGIHGACGWNAASVAVTDAADRA
jgi:phytoene dehydrogenase-like protein